MISQKAAWKYYMVYENTSRLLVTHTLWKLLCPLAGIEPAALQFWCSILTNWATESSCKAGVHVCIPNLASQGFYHAWGEEKPWLPLVTWPPENFCLRGWGKITILHASTSALYTSIARSECSVPINFENHIYTSKYFLNLISVCS
jgi:hypothetical protein